MSKGWSALTRLVIVACTIGCARYSEHATAGEVALDSLPVRRTAWLQLQNGSTADIRVYTVIAGQERYLGSVVATRLKTFVLDARELSFSEVAVTIRRAADSASKTFQPVRVRSGETIDIVVRAKLGRSALVVRGS